MKSRTFSTLLIVSLALAASAVWPNGGPFESLLHTQSAHALTLGSVPSAVTTRPVHAVVSAPASPQGNGFTYQGSLKEGGNPANGQYEFQFVLYDAPTGGNMISMPITYGNQAVTNGLFTVQLDFGPGAFNGEARYLDTSVRQTGGTYTDLSPRQPITPAPYALFALKTQGYKNVVTVAKSGGDYTSIQSALNSITDASATNHFLVWVGPGTYSEQVTMKQYVDIQGSGEQVTKITFPGGQDELSSTVLGASNAELRFLTVESSGASVWSEAILNVTASPSLLHVSALVSGSAETKIGIYSVSGSAPQLDNVAVTVQSGVFVYGVFNENSSTSMNNSTVAVASGTQSIGIATTGTGTTTITNSSITDSSATISIAAGNVKVATSRLAGGPVVGPVTCAGVYDENYAFFASTCP